MKKIRFAVSFIMVVLVMSSYLSCKSAPPPLPEPETAAPAPAPEVQPEPEPQAPKSAPETTPGEAVSQEALDKLNAAIANVEAAQKKAKDFDSPSYFPSEWETAEGKITEAKKMPKNTDADVDTVIAAYNAAADGFYGLFELAIPLYAQAREDEIMALRNDLIAAGARDDFPDYFSPADTAALEALERYEAKDYYAAKDTAAKTLMMYQALTDGYSAWRARQEITAREFQEFDPDNFDSAGEILNAAVEAYNAGDIAAAQENSREALLRYNLVLTAGWAGYARQRSALASAERQAALDIKANIATKNLFMEADANYQSANNTFESKKYEEAAKLFIDAEALFIIASTSASQKRQHAEDVIKQANDKIKESDETARQAEIIIEGGAE